MDVDNNTVVAEKVKVVKKRASKPKTSQKDTVDAQIASLSDSAAVADSKTETITEAAPVKKTRARKSPVKKTNMAKLIPFPNLDGAGAGTVNTANSEPPKNHSNERADVARRVLELSGTIDEAISYMRQKLSVDCVTPDMGEAVLRDVPVLILRDIGEGLLSLSNAVKALRAAEKYAEEDAELLVGTYDAITDTVDTMVDAYLDNRIRDYAILAGTLQSSFKEYSGELSKHCRRLAIN